MTMTANQHKRSLTECKNLDTLQGSANSKRRKVKHYHAEQDGKCIWCREDTWLWWTVSNKQFRKLDKRRVATYEHIIPKSEGGFRSLENGACACQECNTLRKAIPFGSFKYVSANPVRFQKWKDLQLAKVAANKERKDFNKIFTYMKTSRNKWEQRNRIVTLAMMFETFRKYHRVDFYRQFIYNQDIVRQLGVQYGLL